METFATAHIGSLTASTREGWGGVELDFFLGEHNFGIMKLKDFENPIEDGERCIFPVKVYDVLNEEPYDDKLVIDKEALDELSTTEEVHELVLEEMIEQHAHLYLDLYENLRKGDITRTPLSS